MLSGLNKNKIKYFLEIISLFESIRCLSSLKLKYTSLNKSPIELNFF